MTDYFIYYFVTDYFMCYFVTDYFIYYFVTDYFMCYFVTDYFMYYFVTDYFMYYFVTDYFMCYFVLSSLTWLQLLGLIVNIVFLGSAFTIMLVYLWSRRNPYVRLNFFGLMTFHAPYLPWVLLGFSVLLGNSVVIDLMGKYIYTDSY